MNWYFFYVLFYFIVLFYFCLWSVPSQDSRLIRRLQVLIVSSSFSSYSFFSKVLRFTSINPYFQRYLTSPFQWTWMVPDGILHRFVVTWREVDQRSANNRGLRDHSVVTSPSSHSGLQDVCQYLILSSLNELSHSVSPEVFKNFVV